MVFLCALKTPAMRGIPGNCHHAQELSFSGDDCRRERDAGVMTLIGASLSIAPHAGNRQGARTLWLYNRQLIAVKQLRFLAEQH